MGPPHSCSVIIVSPAVPTTPTTPRGASRRGRREAVAAWPAAAVAVVASRANPPERRREESDKYSEIFQNIELTWSEKLKLQLATTCLSVWLHTF